ncbi:MAG: hypothetical protein GX052_04365 [Syntrophomonadaceae bacterium]|jgi:hypothetical protein|nr:hypothetical protein [Syntrophomonadaceae bacterium]
MASTRMFFPGGNTCNGFHSFYRYVVPPDATRLFILKGGPGVGKSTFMKKISADFSTYNLELHWCSSDNNSLDAVVISDYLIAVMDGTAPHIVDPRYPGAVDEIVNLGEFWDESQLVKNKAKIIELTRMYQTYFRIAYLRLQEAGAVWNEITEYFRDSVPDTFLRGLKRTLKQEVLAAGIQPAGGESSERHLFASAITPGGVVNHVSSLLEEDYRVLALGGSPGTGLHDIMTSILEWSREEMLPVEAYHNCFLPSLLEMLIFRPAKTVILDASGMVTNHEQFLSRVRSGRFFDLEPEVDRRRRLQFSGEIEDSRERFNNAISGAIGFLNLAKQLHDELEQFYIPAMDFERIDNKYGEIKKRILGYIGQ